MSRRELHDFLGQLKLERNNSDIVDSEYQLRMDEIIESLEQQKLYPDAFDQYSTLGHQVRELLTDIESQHPSIGGVLNGIQTILQNFKT